MAKLSLFAGSGGLVPVIVQAALQAGHEVQVLAIVPRPDVTEVPVIGVDLADLPGIVGRVKGFGTTHIAMAGAITMPDAAREALAKFAGMGGGQAASTGDAALAGLAGAFKIITGASFVGVHDIAPDLLAQAGHLAGPALDDAAQQSALFALGIAREIGRLDIGQAAIVAGQRVIAVEDIAGTDALLARVATYRQHGMAGDGASSLILAKAVKPQQPLFADLPTIGPMTIANARAAGVSAVVVQAGKTLLIERAELFAAAEAAGIAVLGLALADG